MRFDHIGINVRDLDEAVSFYRDFFGFTVIERWASPRQAFVGKGVVVPASLKRLIMISKDIPWRTSPSRAKKRNSPP